MIDRTVLPVLCAEIIRNLYARGRVRQVMLQLSDCMGNIRSMAVEGVGKLSTESVRYDITAKC